MSPESEFGHSGRRISDGKIDRCIVGKMICEVKFSLWRCAEYEKLPLDSGRYAPAAVILLMSQNAKTGMPMNAFTTHHIEVAPFFDMEMFMTLSQEQRVSGEIMERLERLWDNWLPHLKVRQFDRTGRGYLLVWLGREVEEEVDATWAISPSEGYRCNALAQTLLMAALRELLPEIEEAGCAPAPVPSQALKNALAAEGIFYRGEGPALDRRYALLTPFPFMGGCGACALQQGCPQKQSSGPASVLLPGHEQKVD